jgi:hypothetical protein
MDKLILNDVFLGFNHCVLEPLERELHTNINSNVVQTILALFVYWSFLPFIVSFQHEKLLKI